MKTKFIKVCVLICGMCFIIIGYVKINNNESKSEEKIVIQTNYDVVIEDEIKECLNQCSMVVRGTVIEKIGSEMVPIISDEEFNQLYEDEKIYYQDIITKYKFKISEVIYGECEKDMIVYNVVGGINGNYEQVFSSKEIYVLPNIGDEYILFLKEDNNGGYSTYSMIQGRIEVVKSKDNKNSAYVKINTDDLLFSDCQNISDLKKSINNELVEEGELK